MAAATGSVGSNPTGQPRRSSTYLALRLVLLLAVFAGLSAWPGRFPKEGPFVRLDLLASRQCHPIDNGSVLDCHFRTGSQSRLTFQVGGAACDDLSAEITQENGVRQPISIESSWWSGCSIDLSLFDHRRPQINVSANHQARPQWRTAILQGETEFTPPPLPRLFKGKLPRPNIVLYVVDTLRASRMSLYDYARPTTPRLEAFAKKAAVFDNAYSNGADTRAGIPALLASGTPNQLRGHMRKVDGHPIATMAEVLKRRRYRTGGFQANLTMRESLGFGRGFDDYRVIESFVGDKRVKTSATALHEQALEWIEADKRFPFFAYIQTMDVHNPYDAPPPFRDRYYRGPTERPLPDVSAMEPAAAERILAAYKDLEPDRYDECVEYADHMFGEFLDDLEQLGYADNTIVIVTADHGESLGTGALYPHGSSLDEDIVRIPLMVYLPWIPGPRRVKDVVSLVDLGPTIADLVGMRAPSDYVGRSLFRPRTKHRPSFALGERFVGDQSVEWFLREGPWKVQLRSTGAALYLIPRDNEAREDVSADHPGMTDYLARRVGAFDTRGDDNRPDKEGLGLTDEQMEKVREAMRALGYEDDQKTPSTD